MRKLEKERQRSDEIYHKEMRKGEKPGGDILSEIHEKSAKLYFTGTNTLGYNVMMWEKAEEGKSLKREE